MERSTKTVGGIALVVVTIAIAWFAVSRGGGPGEPRDKARASDGQDAMTVGTGSTETASGTKDDARSSPAGAAEPSRVAAPELPADVTVSEPANVVSVRGRIVDLRRRPIAGATILLHRASRALSPLQSAVDGTFTTAIAPLRVQAPIDLFLYAVDGASNCAATLFVPPMRGAAFDPSAPLDFGSIALRPGGALTVVVRDGERAAAGALVTTRLGEGSLPGPSATCGGDGTCRFPALPAGPVRVRATLENRGSAAAKGVIEIGQEQRFDLTLGALVDIDVTVVDPTGVPIEAAQVELSESVTNQYQDLSGLVNRWDEIRRFPIDIPLTDPTGRTRIVGLPSDVAGWLSVGKDGFEPSRGGSAPGWIELTPDLRSVTLGLWRTPTRTARWKIERGGVEPPPDGSEVRLVSCGMEGAPRPFPARGVVHEGELVVEGLGLSPRLSAWAFAPGDLIAAVVDPNLNSGDDTVQFEPARRLTVEVRDASGRPVVGAAVGALSPDGEQDRLGFLRPATAISDAEGVARFEPFIAGMLLDVFVARGRHAESSQRVGRVDLADGDAHLTAILPDVFDVALGLRIDGVPALPPAFELEGCGGGSTPIVEDPERGELRFQVERLPRVPTRPARLLAEGFVTAEFQLTEPPPGTTARVELDLQHGGRLLAQVIPSAGEVARPHLECLDPTSGDFRAVPGMTDWIQSPNHGEHGYEFTRLAPGTYRIVEGDRRREVDDGCAYLASDPVEVRPGFTAETTLDLRTIRTVVVTIELPEGEEHDLARLVVLGRGAREVAKQVGRQVEHPGLSTAGVGALQLAVDEARPLRVRAWHPWLVPAAEGGEIVVTAAMSRASVRLERAATLSIPLPAPPLAERLRWGCVVLRDPQRAGPPLAVWPLLVRGDVIRCAPLPAGRFELGIVAEGFVPISLPITSDGSDLALPPPAWSLGTTLRVTLPAGTVPSGFMRITATRVDAPTEERRTYGTQDDGELPELSGLWTGRWRVIVDDLRASACLLDREIDVDGVSDQLLELPSG